MTYRSELEQLLISGGRLLDGPSFPGRQDDDDFSVYAVRAAGVYRTFKDSSIFWEIDDQSPDGWAWLDATFSYIIGFTLSDPSFEDEAAEAEAAAAAQSAAQGSTDAGNVPPSPRRADDRHTTFIGAVKDQLYDLLCAESREEDRSRIAREVGAGQKTVVASIAALIAPYLGVGPSQMLSAVIAVTVGLIGQIGLRAWCQSQSYRRSLN